MISRWLALVSLLLGIGFAFAAPASAQGLTHFYCFAQNPRTGMVYVSDAHNVGPVSERGGYGADYSRYLSSKGKVPPGTQAYCNMRSSMAEVRSDIADLVRNCRVCQNPSGFEDVAWPRGGKTAENLLAGKLAPPAPKPDPAKPVTAKPAAPTQPKPAEGVGVYAYVRSDRTDVAYTANEANGATLARYKTDLKGGKWLPLASNDRCPGWMAISAASDGENRHYFYSNGHPDEGAASRAALELAEGKATKMGGAWMATVLVAFLNDFRPEGIDLSDGVIDGLKGQVRQMVTSECTRQRSLGAVGVRG